MVRREMPLVYLLAAESDHLIQLRLSINVCSSAIQLFGTV